MKYTVTNPFAVAFDFSAGDETVRVPAAGKGELKGEFPDETVQRMRDAGLTVESDAKTKGKPAEPEPEVRTSAPVTQQLTPAAAHAPQEPVRSPSQAAPAKPGPHSR